MSRVNVTASMEHTSLGFKLPKIRVETSDHLGGLYHVKGVHPATLGAVSGRGSDAPRPDRFDVKCMLDAKQTAVTLIVNTSKHLPHLAWTSDEGLGKIPLSVSSIVPLLLANRSSRKSASSSSPPKKPKEITNGERSRRPAGKRIAAAAAAAPPRASSASRSMGGPRDHRRAKFTSPPPRSRTKMATFNDSSDESSSGSESDDSDYYSDEGADRHAYARHDSGYASDDYGRRDSRRRRRESVYGGGGHSGDRQSRDVKGKSNGAWR